MVTRAQNPDGMQEDGTPALPGMPSPTREHPYSLRQMTTYALRLGTTGFGGPVALVEYMRRDLVEQRKWITEEDYRQGLTLAQLAPGPLAAQLAIYLGFVHYRVIGATVVGAAFVLPSFVMVVLLGWLYVLYGEATYPVCIKSDASVKDGFAEVKFKPISGKEDQAGGIIWRCRDANNYYVARANALEGNITIYHTIQGKRVAFQNMNEKVAPGQWHTLRVDAPAAHARTFSEFSPCP